MSARPPRSGDPSAIGPKLTRREVLASLPLLALARRTAEAAASRNACDLPPTCAKATAAAPFILGFCWPLSAAQGDNVTFYTSTAKPGIRYVTTYVSFSNQDASKVCAKDIRNSLEVLEHRLIRPLERSGCRF